MAATVNGAAQVTVALYGTQACGFGFIVREFSEGAMLGDGTLVFALRGDAIVAGVRAAQKLASGIGAGEVSVHLIGVGGYTLWRGELAILS